MLGLRRSRGKFRPEEPEIFISQRPNDFRRLAVLAAVAALLALAAPAAQATPSPEPAVVTVEPSDIGAVNFVGDWKPTAHNNGAWDVLDASLTTNPEGQPYTVPFSELPAAGSRWVLDIEGKAAGSVNLDAADSDYNALVMTTDYPAGADWPTVQKVRLQYFFGTGGYPTIDDGSAVTVAEIFAGEFSYTQQWIPGPGTPGGTGTNGVEVRLESPDGTQRVTIFTESAATTTAQQIVLSEESFTWKRNSVVVPWCWSTDGTNCGGTDFSHGEWLDIATEANYAATQQAPETVTELVQRFGDWRVVSFGPNLGRGAHGTALISELTILGTTFKFDVEPTFQPEPETVLDPADELGAAGDVVDSGGSGQYTLHVDPSLAGEHVAIYINSTPTFVGWHLVGPTGLVRFTIPSSVAPGTHSIVLYDSTGTYLGWFSGFLVTLPATGAPIPWLAIAGASVAILAGAILVVARPRRASRS